MRKIHSFLLVSLAILSFALSPTKAKASHAAGGEIIYEWIADSTYRVFFKFYRDCTGIPEDASVPLCVSNTCTSFQTNLNLSKWTGPLPGGVNNGDPVSAGCSKYKNKCDSPLSNLPGYREWWYSGIITLPFQCNYWRFSVAISARNGSLNMGGGNLYVETTFDNLHFQGNSSPYFSIKPIPYVCVNTPYSYNNGAIDPNNDSLSTDVINPLDGASCGPGTAIPLSAGTPPIVIPGNPFQTNNTFTTNAATGQMNFTASIVGAHTLTTRVREYKGGQLVGYIMRDIQVQVLNCTTSPPTVPPVVPTVGSTLGLGGRIEGCIGQLMEFEWDMTASDPTTILLAEDNHLFSIPGATVTYTNLKTSSVHAKFSWTPGVLDAGTLKNLIVTIKDSTCKPPGIMLYYPFSIPVYVWPAVQAVPDTSVCPGETAYLNVTGGGNYLWSVLPGGSPVTSLSCTNCTAPVATPTLPTSYVVTSQASSVCVNNNKDTVNVGVLPGLVFTPVPDAITCPNNSVVLDLKVAPPPGVTYTAKWTPATFLNNDASTAPTSTPNSSITYRVVLTSSANKCKGYDTVLVDVLTGFTLNNGDTAICDGQKINVSATGDGRYTYSWSSTNPTPGVFSNPNIIDPSISPSPVGTNTYTLKASYASCRDSVAEFDIEVQPNPTVTVDNDAILCMNDTMRMHGVVLPAGYPFDLTWTPGASLDNAKIANPVYTAQQTTTLKLTATSSAGCTSSDEVKLETIPSAFVFPLGDTAICPGATTQLHVVGNGIKSFRWYPEATMSDKMGTDPFVTPSSTTVYTIYAVDTNSCNDTASVKVVVYPKATVQLPDSIRIYPGEAYQMEPLGNCTYFSWFPPVGLNKADVSNPIAKPEVNTRYMVTAKTESGCVATDSVNVLVSPESIVDIPNAFVPGNGLNGTFKVLRRGDVILKSFTIYNRWGQKVFETNDIDKGWDGTFSGKPQPLGVYIYSVEGATNTGQKFTKQGNVTLIR